MLTMTGSMGSPEDRLVREKLARLRKRQPLETVVSL
jgi:hypothetical protein